MNIQVISDEKKPLLKRREIIVRLGYEDKTPSRLEIRKELAKKRGVKEDLLLVTRIKPWYGTPAASVEVVVYDDEAALKEVEPDYMIKRHLSEERREGKEEKKSEEKKEEKKEVEEETKKEASDKETGAKEVKDEGSRANDSTDKA